MTRKLDQLPLELVTMIADSISSVDNDARSAQRTMLAFSRVNEPFGRILTLSLCKHNAEKRGGSAFKRAIKRRRRDLVRHLLYFGAETTSQKSGYPLFLAIKEGCVEIFEYIWSNAQGSFLPTAIFQRVDNDQNTLLHWAIRRALVPCVNRPLNAGAIINALNHRGSHPIDYLFESAQRHHASPYAAIIRLLLDLDAAEMLKPLNDPNTAGIIGSTTPLIQAASHASLECVNALLESTGAHQDVTEYINEVSTSHGWTALASVCDPSHLPCNQLEGYRVLEVVKTLLIRGADANEVDQDMEGGYALPIYKACLRPLSVNDTRQLLRTIKLQHDAISELIDHGAEMRPLDGDPFYCMKFLETAEYYSIYALDPGKLVLEAEDIWQDTHPILKFDTTVSPSDIWSRELGSEEVKKEETLRLLQGAFQKLLTDLEGEDFATYCGPGSLTLSHRAATIPGPFGVWATQVLLEKGASVDTENRRKQDPLRYAASKNVNRGSISILRHWARYLRRH